MSRRATSPAARRGAAVGTPNKEPRTPKEKAPLVWGEYAPHAHLSGKNILNAILCVVVLVPSYTLVFHLYTSCPNNRAPSSSTLRCNIESLLFSPVVGDAPGGWCDLAMNHPVSFANALFFINVTVGFWLIGLLQRSFWLIDPYWTIIPPLLGHLYQMHPNAHFDPVRSRITLALLWLWSVRLTHSYFRREGWKFGEREDWRYTKMAKDFPRLWPVLSFFAVGLAQQPMLVGISLPAYSVHFASAAPLGVGDVVAVVGCLAGLYTAWRADNELRVYMTSKPRPAPILETGLWRFSRHPNYFGEQLWWWSFAGFSVCLGEWYMLAGTAFNSVILATVTLMTEERMLKNWSAARAKLYREYMRTTSPCIPWFKRR